MQAALVGAPGIAYGNIVGSNIANILLIVGVSAFLWPIAVTSAALRRDGLVMVGVAVLFAMLAGLVSIGRPVGAAFIMLLAAYLYIAIRQERRAPADQHGAAYDKGVAL